MKRTCYVNWEKFHWHLAHAKATRVLCAELFGIKSHTSITQDIIQMYVLYVHTFCERVYNTNDSFFSGSLSTDNWKIYVLFSSVVGPLYALVNITWDGLSAFEISRLPTVTILWNTLDISIFNVGNYLIVEASINNKSFLQHSGRGYGLFSASKISRFIINERNSSIDFVSAVYQYS